MTEPGGRGVDGVTAEELRSGRQIWWDAAFTRWLLESIPEHAQVVADLGCGLGRAAHDLLPARAGLRYIGVDLDDQRLSQAREELVATDFGDRAELREGDLLALPLGDASVDVALVVMTLQHVAEPAAALLEVHRVLALGGSAVIIEPDNLDQRAYFGGVRSDIAAALSRLYAQARAARLPRDLAIGPRLPGLVAAAGFADVSFRAHLIQTANRETAADFVERISRVARIVAASVGETSEVATALRDVDAALRAFSGEVSADRVEIGLLSTTAFRVVARRA